MLLDKKKLNEERISYVKLWANYVKTQPNEVWSKDQGMFINAMLKNQPPLTRKQYLKVKNELGR